MTNPVSVLQAKGVSIVTRDGTTTPRSMTVFPPSRVARTPPGICKKRYPTKKPLLA